MGLASEQVHFAVVIGQESLEHLAWEEIGDEDPKDRLLTAALIGGVPHHLEAIAVEEVPDPDPDFRPDQVASSYLYRHTLDLYKAADSGTDEPFCTVEIRGRQYCLFMTPYRE